MIAAFFQEEPEKFDTFWSTIGNRHIGGQKRAARSRSKKAQYVSEQFCTYTNTHPLVCNII